jgi:hypothetical protein
MRRMRERLSVDHMFTASLLLAAVLVSLLPVHQLQPLNGQRKFEVNIGTRVIQPETHYLVVTQ